MAFTTRTRPARPSPPGGGTRRPPQRSAKRLPRRVTWWLGAAAVIAVAAMVATLTGGGREGAATAAAGGGRGPTTRIVLASAGGSVMGDQAPAFTATTTTGTSFSLPAGKPAVLFFMAGWCASCIPEATALENIRQDYGDRVAILGVDADPSDSLRSLRGFRDVVGAGYGFVFDRDGTLTQALRARSLDTTVVVDAAGRIVYRDGYPTEEATLREALAKAGLA